MPTTVSKTISRTTGGNFNGSTAVQDWINSLNGLNLISADQIQQGQILNNGEFIASGVVADFTGISITTDATRYVELTAASGASFVDNARTNSSYYNAANGVALRNTGSSGYTIKIGVLNLKINRLQIASDAGSSGSFQGSGGSGLNVINQCIIQGVESLAQSAITLSNCDIIATSSPFNRCFVVADVGTYDFDFCTFVVPNGVTINNIIDCSNAGATVNLNSCAFFGAASAIITRGGSATINYTTCATDLAGTTGLTGSLTYANQFVSSTNDFREKAGASLQGVGTAIDGITVDISDFTRTTPPDIGAYNLAAAALGVPIWLYTT